MTVEEELVLGGAFSASEWVVVRAQAARAGFGIFLGAGERGDGRGPWGGATHARARAGLMRAGVDAHDR